MSSGRRFGISVLLALSLPALSARPEPGAAGASPSRLAWALKPGILERLSPGARQAVLVANGLAQAPARHEASAPGRVAAASAFAAPAPRQNVRVNDPTLDVDHHSARTTSIAARGSRVFVGFEDATYTAAGYGVSNDGGATFAHMRISVASGDYAWGSPSVAMGPAGEIYYAFLSSAAGDPTSVTVAKSTDGGLTFPGLSSPSAGVENGYDVMDKPAIAVDNGASSPRKGTVYAAWTYYFSQYGYTAILCSHAADGASFTNPAILSIIDGAPVDHAAVAVAPNGDVYVAYQNGHLSPSGISITRSTDGGQVFGALRTVASFQPAGPLTAGSGGAVSNPGPALAVDGNGVVHVAWAAVASGATSDRSDVFYARSTDNATTFSAAKKLNDDGTATTQAFPALAALPDGTVGVRWADRRNDAARDTLSDVYMVFSRDAGVTWGRNFRITDRNSPWAPFTHALVDSGLSGHTSYDGLAADGGSFFVAWTDERSGDADVYAAAVPATFDAATPDFNLSALNTYSSVPQGGAATFDLAASASNGFAGTLALAPDLAPSGLTVSLAGGTVLPGQTVRLTVTASVSAAPGDYVFGVAATSGGLVRGTRMRVTVTDRTAGIAPPVNVTRTSGFSTGSVKADGSGVLHAVTDDDSGSVTGSEVFYRRSTDGGATFTAAVKLHATGSFARESAFTIDPTGRIFVVWSGKLAADPTPRIYFVKSTDGGATFSAPLAINGNTGYAVLPNIAADRNGNLVVGWYDLSGDAAVVGWSRSTNAGTSFGTPVAVFDSPVVFTRPAVAIDSKNNAYLAWNQQSSSASAIRLSISKAGGAFGAPATVSDSSVLAFAPDLAVGPDDSLGLAMYTRAIVSNLTQNRVIAFQRSTNGGGSFSSPVYLSSAADQSYVPAVAFEPSGAIDVVWEEFDGNDVQSDVWVARSTNGGAGFSAPVNLSRNGGLSGGSADPGGGLGGPGRASVSAGANGTLVVSWADDTGSALDVFVSTPRAALISNRPPVPVITSPAPNATFEAGVPVTFSGSATDPDGDAVTLAWDFGDGRAGAGATPAAHPFAVPGTYLVTLTATDTNGGSGAATINVVVTTPASGGAGTSLLVPVVLEAPGIGGSRYTSEVTLVSRAVSPADVVLAYTASAGAGTGYARIALAAGEMRVLPGFLDWLRGQGLPIPADGSTQIGTLLATFRGVSDASLVFSGARTFTQDPAGTGGTFGLFSPAIGTTATAASLFGLQQSASQRSNVAVVNAGASPITVRVALQGPNGEDLGVLPDQPLGPWGWAQFNQPLAGKAQAGRALVTRVSGFSPFSAYGVLNDAVTSDGSYVPPVLGDDGSGADVLVPVVLDVAGLGARFRTELTLTNTTSSPLPLVVAYVAAPGFGSGSGTVSVTLAPGEQRVVPDAIALLRATLPIENDGRNVGGSLRVRASSGTPASALAVGARTYVPLAPSGSYGLFYPGLTAAQCATGSAFVYGLQENASQRSNLAVVNRGDASDSITLRVTYYGTNGAVLGAPVDRLLGPGEWFQFGRPLSGLGASAGYAKIERTSGASRFAAYGVLNDNTTSDGSYVAMSF
jgi:PKD repeat protein